MQKSMSGIVPPSLGTALAVSLVFTLPVFLLSMVLPNVSICSEVTVGAERASSHAAPVSSAVALWAALVKTGEQNLTMERFDGPAYRHL